MQSRFWRAGKKPAKEEKQAGKGEATEAVSSSAGRGCRGCGLSDRKEGRELAIQPQGSRDRLSSRREAEGTAIQPQGSRADGAAVDVDRGNWLGMVLPWFLL